MTAMPIVDTDTHLSEPPDLWVSRVSKKKWGDAVPHVVYDERRGQEIWVIGDRRTAGVAGYAFAGWHEYPPNHPPTVAEADPAAFDAGERVKRMNREGIVAEVLYANLLAFSMDAFMDLGDLELSMECVRAYNDFLVDFASGAPDRFILQTTLPFWDVKASVAEIERCHELGHRGINFMTKPYKFGLPPIADDHWEPILKTVEDLGVPVSFHTGYQGTFKEDWKRKMNGLQSPTAYAKEVVMDLMGLVEGSTEVLFGGVCHRYPGLNFINVESGFGWVPYLLESADWFWVNSGCHKEFPERELPSFYYRRQMYATFWFERETVRQMGESFADNLMFETDFPHPTSLSPGPVSNARPVREVVDDMLTYLPADMCKKVLYENAARLYGVDVPTTAS